jgi:hypothetical protein
MSIYVNIISSHPTKQPINKRTYVVTYPHQSHIHHVLINESVYMYIPWGYADTPGNGPTQSRFILFARSLKIFIITFYY